MNPQDSKHPHAAAASPRHANKTPDTAKKSLDLNLKTLIPKLKMLKQRLSKHFPFIVLIAALLVYLFVVWNIRGLITAEPTLEAEEQALTETKVPSIDQKAITQIQSLEKSNSQIRSLFNEARTNPFHE